MEVRGEPRHVLFQEPPELVNSYFEAKKDHFCILIKPVHADCVSSKRAFPFDGDRLNHLDQTFQRCQEIINFSPSSPCPQLLSYWSDFLDKPWSTPTRHAAWHTFDKIFTRITPDPLKGSTRSSYCQAHLVGWRWWLTLLQPLFQVYHPECKVFTCKYFDSWRGCRQ